MDILVLIVKFFFSESNGLRDYFDFWGNRDWYIKEIEEFENCILIFGFKGEIFFSWVMS